MSSPGKWIMKLALQTTGIHAVQGHFKHTLKQYGTIEALNEAWGKHFWSLTFNSFEEIITPMGQPQIDLNMTFFNSLNVFSRAGVPTSFAK